MDKDAALQILGKRFAHVGFGAVVVALAVELTRAGQLQPGLVVLCHCLVQQRTLGVAWVVELGFCSGWHECCTNEQYSAAIAWVRKAQHGL
jgi:hypothetical protein